MKKTTKHGRKLARKVFADPSSVYKVMGRIQHFTQSELMALSIPPHLAFESLRTGRGTENDFHTLAAVANTVLVCGEKIGNECVDAAKLAQKSLVLMLDRSVKLGKWGVDAGALQNIPPVLDLHDQLLTLYTPLQLQNAMTEVIKRMKAGETLGVQDFES